MSDERNRELCEIQVLYLFDKIHGMHDYSYDQIAYRWYFGV